MTSSSAPVTTPAALLGPIRRSLYRDVDGRRDETTQVIWFQGPSLYVDLRRPAWPNQPRPDLSGLTGPADLATAPVAAVRWLGGHEGFAGTFTVVGDLARWERVIDLQPATGVPDEGRLHWDSGTLVEVGVHAAYVEHWHPEPAPTIDRATGPAPDAATGAGAVLLREQSSGRAGVLVRVGARFAVARGRATPLPVGTRLTALLLAADPVDRAALLDCEVALGRIDPDGRWIVEVSTLPYREGHDLAPDLDGAVLTTADTGPAGPIERTWHIVRSEGGSLLPPRAEPRPAHPDPPQQQHPDTPEMAGDCDAAQ